LFNWSTATESNNSYFTLEKSENGEIFEPVSKIKGVGNSTTEQNYSCTYEEDNINYKYYRLKQTDFNGNYKILKTIYLNSIDVIGKLTLYPNPVDNQLNVKFESSEDSEFIINITDMIGRLQKTINYSALKGANEATIDVETLSSGSYYVTIINNNGSRPQTLKFFKTAIK
jgi:hypothetical protein